MKKELAQICKLFEENTQLLKFYKEYVLGRPFWWIELTMEPKKSVIYRLYYDPEHRDWDWLDIITKEKKRLTQENTIFGEDYPEFDKRMRNILRDALEYKQKRDREHSGRSQITKNIK